MTLRALIFRYAVFAVIATAANLAAQRIVLQHDTSVSYLMAALGAGTLAGLVVKYVLDKRWIFYDIETGVKSQSQKFSLYAAMGAVTTAIFWGVETAFWLIWHTPEMREIGAIIGLIVGYIVKYNLDRRFVFACSQLAHPQ